MTNSNGETKVVLTLVGLDGNAFSLMGAFSKAAQRQGFDPADIKEVIDECMTSDYDHLLQTLIKHTVEEEVAS